MTEKNTHLGYQHPVAKQQARKRLRRETVSLASRRVEVPSAEIVRVPSSKSLPLIQAKLHRPAVGRLFLGRPRLSEQLNRGLAGPLSLVCAPAGFGKTTAISV